MPNFAHRPSSDISMLDGLTFMSFSPSSSDNESDGSTSRPPSTTKHLEWALSRPEEPKRPKITVTAPSGEAPQSRSRSLSEDGKTLERPRLRKKAQTAPPGALSPSNYVPPQPRRAVSTRIGHSNTMKRRSPQSDPEIGSSSTARTALSEKNARPQRQLPEVTPTMKCADTVGTGGKQEEPANSFSRKARVMQALKKKQIRMLNTDNSDFKPKKLSSSPSSMLSTPKELYAIQEQHSKNESVPGLRTRNRKSIMSISPMSRSPSVQSETRSANELVQGASGDVCVDETRRIYLPGPICLEERPMKPRKDSCASMDLYDHVRETKANSFSDMVCLDGIVMFFEEFGVVEQVKEETLDKFWLSESQKDRDALSARRLSLSSTEDKVSKGHSQAPSPRGAKFYFSSASSTASLPSTSGTQKRQRTRLRKFLSPALPGSAFLKTPASLGKQQEIA